MKKIFYISIIISKILFSFRGYGQNRHMGNQRIHYFIRGSLVNGNGNKLALIIPCEGIDHHQVVKIDNEKFEFKGKLEHPEKAYIRFEKEITNYDGSYFNFPIFLTNDTILIQAELDNSHRDKAFKDISISNSKTNEYYLEKGKEFWENFSGVIFTSDSILNDSLRKFVYPVVRKKY